MVFFNNWSEELVSIRKKQWYDKHKLTLEGKKFERCHFSICCAQTGRSVQYALQQILKKSTYFFKILIDIELIWFLLVNETWLFILVHKSFCMKIMTTKLVTMILNENILIVHPTKELLGIIRISKASYFSGQYKVSIVEELIYTAVQMRL